MHKGLARGLRLCKVVLTGVFVCRALSLCLHNCFHGVRDAPGFSSHKDFARASCCAAVALAQGLFLRPLGLLEALCMQPLHEGRPWVTKQRFARADESCTGRRGG